MGIPELQSERTDTLVDLLQTAHIDGERPLHLFMRGRDLILALWRYPSTGIDEIPLGSGPFTRPSRSGFPEFWAAERAIHLPEMFADESPAAVASGMSLHEMPLGPVRADVAEALRFELTCLGDEILAARIVNGFKHRHVERLMAGSDAMAALEVAERVTGTSPVAHATAFALAVESALGLEVPRSVGRQRLVLLELERLASHLSDLAALAASTGTPVAAAELYRLKDLVLRFNQAWAGHRYLRGVVAPGGARRALEAPADALRALLRQTESEFSAIRRQLDRMTSFLDRLHGAGRVPEGFRGLVGFVGRAGGRSEDVRWDRPYAAYDEVTGGRRQPVAAAGDAHARYVIRCTEIDFSILALRRLADCGPAPAAVLAPRDGSSFGWGIVEAPRGRLAYRVEISGGLVRSVSVRTPSSINWPALPAAVANHNILQDFPIIDASFSLCAAALDL